MARNLTNRHNTSRALLLRARSRLSDLLSLILTLLFLVQFESTSLVNASLADGPELSMEITSRDFGDVFDGEELEQNFPVRNAGTKPLEFSQKSTLSRAETNSNPRITAAVWHHGSEYAPSRVAAMRAAPS